jgi:hypothetical protein
VRQRGGARDGPSDVHQGDDDDDGGRDGDRATVRDPGEHAVDGRPCGDAESRRRRVADRESKGRDRRFDEAPEISWPSG